MATKPVILGICGAPGTGKTTIAGWLHRKLSRDGLDCELLSEPARLLAKQGIHIDTTMQAADYDAFLEAYLQRDRATRATLAIADRTPVDHCSYLQANRNMQKRFVSRHRREARAAMSRYRLVFYLPVQFPLRDDGFRTTSEDYRHELDQAIQAMLGELAAPVVELRGNKTQRQRLLLNATCQTWPELFGISASAGG